MYKLFNWKINQITFTILQVFTIFDIFASIILSFYKNKNL